MKPKGWIAMLLLVPLMAQAMTAVPAGACSMAKSSGSHNPTAHTVHQQHTMPAMAHGSHPGSPLSAVPDRDSEGSDRTGCCPGSGSAACPVGSCQMGGCGGAHFVVLWYEVTLPVTAAQNFSLATPAQPYPLSEFFRPPIV